MKKKGLIVGVVFLLVLAGGLTGFVLAKKNSGSVVTGGIIKTEKITGFVDTKTFPDKAEGVLEKGSLSGEGTHKLVRNPKDSSQTAALTSSIVNLDDFIGKKVRVYGQTFAAQKAGWLMDVGRVELLE